MLINMKRVINMTVILLIIFYVICIGFYVFAQYMSDSDLLSYSDKTKCVFKKFEHIYTRKSVRYGLGLSRRIVILNSVYFSQNDPRWRNVMYSIRNDPSQTIGTSGCGPTSMAIIVSTLTDKVVTPSELCNYAIKNGYRTYDNGTRPEFFYAVAKEFKLGCKFFERSDNLDFIKEAIKSGKMVIACVNKGHFTKDSHYIVIYGWEVDRVLNEWFLVMDPNDCNDNYGKDDKIIKDSGLNGCVKVAPDILINEAIGYWIFDAKFERR